jgi:uncharacterized protein (UPF0264 family)
MRTLVSPLGTCEVLMALGAGSALLRVVGVVGGVSLAVAPWVIARFRALALVLVVVGTVPFAALTLTSLVTPLLSLLAWILMGLIYRDEAARDLPAPAVSRLSSHRAGTALT